MRLSVLAFVWGMAFAQETPPAVKPSTDTPAPPPVLQNSGKPMLLPLQCTDEDIQLSGLTCSEEDPCPIYLEVAAVESVGNRIFLAGNLHAPAVTLSSTLLASDDGGQTWREAHERIRSAGLDRIQFLDAEVGWVAGEKLSPLPQDPFLLLTSDGGKTWRVRSIFSETADNRLGSIQQFFFTSKDNGSLIIDRGQGSDGDRYELYESPDAGESWNFKQSSTKPLSLRKTAAVGTEWRLRVDGRTQSFHVEHRESGKWADVASFAVKVGVCKP
jgi:photosystem II stability/assembly factor-like uncharacterized protein